MIVQSLEELESDLRNGLRPVYLVLGPETYLCRMAVASLKKQALSPDSAAFDYSEFAAGEATVDEIMHSAGTFPMMSKRRMVLLTDAEKLKAAEQEALLGALGNLSPKSMLVLVADTLDHRIRFYKTLRDTACVAEFPKLKGIAMEKWADAFLRRQGYRASSATIKMIVELGGADLQSLASELEKLMLSAGKEKTIPDSAIEDLVHASRQRGIFELINAVSQSNRAGALKCLANLLETGEHPLVVVTMMARHCRQILIAKEGLLRGDAARDIGSAAQISAYFLDSFLRQARAADAASVQEMYVRIAAIDKKIKSSSLDERMMLEGLICALV